MSESGSKSEYEYVYVMVNSDKEPVKGGVIKTEKELKSWVDDKGVVNEGDGEDVGVIFGNKRLQGGCGGLASVGIEKSCDCETVCDEHQILYQIQEPKE